MRSTETNQNAHAWREKQWLVKRGKCYYSCFCSAVISQAVIALSCISLQDLKVISIFMALLGSKSCNMAGDRFWCSCGDLESGATFPLTDQMAIQSPAVQGCTV